MVFEVEHQQDEKDHHGNYENAEPFPRAMDAPA